MEYGMFSYEGDQAVDQALETAIQHLAERPPSEDEAEAVLQVIRQVQREVFALGYHEVCDTVVREAIAEALEADLIL
jgi:hypothetical protein